MKHTILMLTLVMLAACNTITNTTGTTEYTTEIFSYAVNDAESVNMTIDVNARQFNLGTSTDQLVEGEVDIIGKLENRVGSGSDPDVHIREDSEDKNYIGDDTLTWAIDLNPTLPTDLTVDLNAVNSILSLGALNLTGFRAETNAGSLTAVLPGGDYNIRLDGNATDGTVNILEGYTGTIDLDSNAGAYTLNVGEASNVEIRLELNAGSVIVRLPEGAGARLEVQGEQLVTAQPRDDMRSMGTGEWETEGFADAAYQVTVVVTDANASVVTIR